MHFAMQKWGGVPMPLSKGVLQPMLRQAQQTCCRLRAFPELVEGFQVLNLMALGV